MKLFLPQDSSLGYKRCIFYNFLNNSFSLYSDHIKSNKFTDLGDEDIVVLTENYLNWDAPNIISNAIFHINPLFLDLDKSYIHFLLEACTLTNCQHIVIRISDFIEINLFSNLLQCISEHNIHSILIICDYYHQYYTDEFGEIIMNLSLNKNLIVLKSPFEKNIEDTMFFTRKKDIGSYRKSLNEFNASITLFSESQLHHTYFNRKLYIGPNGEIKNALECEETFGYIKNLNSVQDLKEIIETPAFQKYWFVHKDLCDVCKHCEFRHMCVDNRLPFERTENEWYHKIECNYNPFIAKWEGEPGYKTLDQCGVISNENIFSIDIEKIKQINQEI